LNRYLIAIYLKIIRTSTTNITESEHICLRLSWRRLDCDTV